MISSILEIHLESVSLSFFKIQMCGFQYKVAFAKIYLCSLLIFLGIKFYIFPVIQTNPLL